MSKRLALDLSSVSIFGGLDADARAVAAAHATRIHVAVDRTFFRAGDPARVTYALLSGRVKITEISAEGHEVILRVHGAGEVFGAVAALVDTAAYPVTARAMAPSDALAWTGPAMTDLMRRFPPIAVNVARMVALRLHDLQRVHHELMTDRVERRIARALLRLATQAGRHVDGGVEIDLPLSRQDFAQMTGTTLFTVSRTFSRWHEAGLIATARRRVVVCQPHRLAEIADDLPASAP